MNTGKKNIFDTDQYFIVQFGDKDGSNIYGFQRTKTGPKEKASIEENLRYVVHRDNQFIETARLDGWLDAKVFILDEMPQFIRLPEDRDSAVGEIVLKNPVAADEFKTSLAKAFLGNSYSMDFKHMVGIGEFVSAEVMERNFPEAFDAMMKGPIFVYSFDSGRQMPWVNTRCKEGQMMMEREREKETIDIFCRMVPDSDLPLVAETFDVHDAQGRSSTFIMEHWINMPAQYSGIAYTDLSIGTTVKTWKETEIHRSFVEKHARFVGTVGDLLRSGDLQWPQAKPRTLSGAFAKAGKLLSKRGRYERADRKKFDRAVAAIRKSVFAPK